MRTLAARSLARPRWLVSLVAALVFAAGCQPPVPSGAPSAAPSAPSTVSSAEILKRAIPTVVKIVGWQDGAPAFTGSGFGGYGHQHVPNLGPSGVRWADFRLTLWS